MFALLDASGDVAEHLQALESAPNGQKVGKRGIQKAFWVPVFEKTPFWVFPASPQTVRTMVLLQ